MDLQAFLASWEASLDPRHPERAKPPARVLGYGEISTVLGIAHLELERYAIKRMPMFRDRAEVDAYLDLHAQYIAHLERAGIYLPATELIPVPRPRGGYAVYILQEKLPAESIGNQLLHTLGEEDARRLVQRVLEETRKVFQYNAHHAPSLALGFDAQISNWAVLNVPLGAKQLPPEPELMYFDTSTPLMQVKGQEQLNPELFLRSAPSFLVPIIRLLFLDDVLTRYYDFRSVVLDIIANFYKEKRAEWIPQIVDWVNTWRHQVPELVGKPYTVEEIRSYYREDAFIWRFYLAARKLDRRIHQLLGREYPYILPPRIER